MAKYLLKSDAWLNHEDPRGTYYPSGTTVEFPDGVNPPHGSVLVKDDGSHGEVYRNPNFKAATRAKGHMLPPHVRATPGSVTEAEPVPAKKK